MLERKAMKNLEEWKAKVSNKCLIVEGARQIGKTYIIEKFGRNNYESFIEINFIENPSLKVIFSGDLDADSILMAVKLNIPGIKIIPGSTLLFLDEIQECEEAISALKFLAADDRISVICSGSALGMDYKPKRSYPVGSVEHLDMYSLDFEEFLWAMGIERDMVSDLRSYFDNKNFDKKVPLPVHRKFEELIRQYMVIGGMPEVVQTFVDTGDYYEADRIQRRLYRDYLNDIARYANAEDKIRAEKCYKMIPLQLSKENHKYQYSLVEKKGTSKKYESSIDWLGNAHIAIPVTNVKAIQYPLKSFAIENNFRLYPNDIGLLMCTYGYELKAAILADSDFEKRPENVVLGTAKGGMYEALACEMLCKNGHDELFFYRNETGTVEMEFVIEKPDGILPIEIKAGRSRTRSLNAILEDENIKCGYKFSFQNIGKSGKKVTLPFYMLMFV